MKTHTFDKRLVVTVIVICILIAAAVVGGFLLRGCFGPAQGPSDANDSAAENAFDDTAGDDSSDDLVALFGENAQILNVIDAADSSDVLQEGQVADELQSRGFGECVITSEYAANGQYSEAEEISPTSSKKHPTYEALYVTPLGELWNLLYYNGHLMANPVSYNADSPRDVQLIVSESESVTSYVSTSNKFYEVIPPESELIVKQVDRIDAATLNTLTAEEIDRL